MYMSSVVMKPSQVTNFESRPDAIVKDTNTPKKHQQCVPQEQRTTSKVEKVHL